MDKNDPFADIADLEDFENEPTVDRVNRHTENIAGVEIPGFEENCSKCNGSGTYGRVTRLGHSRCTKCKGSGKLQFKTSPEARAKARTSAAARKVKKAEKQLQDGLAALPEDVRDWLNERQKDAFASSLRANLSKYGSLTERQVEAVRANIAKEDDASTRGAEWKQDHQAEYQWLKTESDNGNEFAQSLFDSVHAYGYLTERQLQCVQRGLKQSKKFEPSDLDISGLKGYFAVPDGDTRLKICVRKPGKNSRFFGWTFVDDGAAYGSRQTYGKQAPEGKYQGRIQDALRAILKDPLEAQVAYGKLTGTCGRCGRLLEDEASVAAGIGPICAAKYSA